MLNHQQPLLGYIDFKRGFKGEIIPPSLVDCMDPIQMTQEFLGIVGISGKLLLFNPTFCRLSKMYFQQAEMARVFTGERNDELAVALRESILTGNMLSLRPLGQEEKIFFSFYPILRLADPLNWIWEIGLSFWGTRYHSFTQPDLSKAYLQARDSYAQWADEDTLMTTTNNGKSRGNYVM
ncbi:MAG: hypothetical protein AB9888_13005 [Bacteroidales bacterium]